MISKGFTKAFIVAYVNGTRTSAWEVAKLNNQINLLIVDMETNNQDYYIKNYENTILSAFIRNSPYDRSPNFGSFGHASRRWVS